MTRGEVESRIAEIIAAANSYKAAVYNLRDELFEFAEKVGTVTKSISDDIVLIPVVEYSSRCEGEIIDSINNNLSRMKNALGTLSADATKAIKELVDAYNNSLDSKSKEPRLSYTDVNLLD